MRTSFTALDPVPRYQEIRIERFFRRPWRRLPVVAPCRARRHRHEDRFGAPARLQAEQGAAVVDQVEFDIASAAVGLEFALALAERQALSSLDDRQIGGQEMLADRAHQREAGVEVGLGEVVEEDAADAARLVAMLEVEVL